MPLRLTPQQWRSLLGWFVRGLPSAQIARETRLDRKRVLRALTAVRLAITRSVVVGAQRVGTPELSPAKPLPRRLTALGLTAAHGHAWADVVPDAVAEQLRHVLRTPNPRDAIAWLDLREYSAVVYRGRLYRVATPVSDRAPFGQVEAFWAYLKRRLRAKGGIRRERLGLYLAEFAWRYNHRQMSPADQVRELLALLRQRSQVEEAGPSLT